MAIVTFLSDFGNTDHYVAAVKAKMLRVNPGLQIIDISHSVRKHNLIHCSYLLKNVFREFPAGSVHLVCVAGGQEGDGEFIAVKLEEHYFVGRDNGLFSLLSDHASMGVVELANKADQTFPEKVALAEAAARLASGETIHNLGPRKPEMRKLLNRTSRATKKQIQGHVIHVDHFGNLVTNILKQDFDILTKERGFTIIFGREKHNKIFKNYNEVEPGECFTLFNSDGVMEIGISQGNASELLGLDFDSPVNIIFDESTP
ncbi:SAM hydrolase/SAM-dependent halogenase family protein [Mangrovivirga cuniculi]|uniref:S-adenosyl-l-methionine hydroxide adenosyltransferase n=1 Tax=Mangrovivirga cuniculi TaxID=2715131 RepID=A0A4D7JNS1_9BACT|nr:SAM-dependent chlorinase/fluorinase [Mangrovivirga cuniculi]QCK16317.1 S-adenosyl-l-methionine hydroxide adenosyltransferase [Mangrovivirga cuniculi]